MWPGRIRKSSSCAIGDPGNVEKDESLQALDIGVHIAPIARTLQNVNKNPRETTNRPSRNVRPFIWPSFGWESVPSCDPYLAFVGLR
jgi:hypothetical protein